MLFRSVYCGTGFMLMKRAVLERMVEAYPEPAYRSDHVHADNPSEQSLYHALFDCMIDRETGDPERAKPVKQYVQHELDKIARLRVTLKPMMRQPAPRAATTPVTLSSTTRQPCEDMPSRRAAST